MKVFENFHNVEIDEHEYDSIYHAQIRDWFLIALNYGTLLRIWKPKKYITKFLFTILQRIARIGRAEFPFNLHVSNHVEK